MTTGIIVCGLNGSGKSTLGKALAEKLGYNFIVPRTYTLTGKMMTINMPFPAAKRKPRNCY